MINSNLYLGFISGIIFGVVIGVNMSHFFPTQTKLLVVTQTNGSAVLADSAGIAQETLRTEQAAQLVTNKIYFCPDAATVYAHIKQAGNWRDQGLQWSFDHRIWEPDNRLRFERMLLKKSVNELSCYYVWPDPRNAKTKRWLTLSLQVDYNQVIEREGKHWNRGTGLNKLLKRSADRSYAACNATSVRACAFSIKIHRKK